MRLWNKYTTKIMTKFLSTNYNHSNINHATYRVLNEKEWCGYIEFVIHLRIAVTNMSKNL